MIPAKYMHEAHANLYQEPSSRACTEGFSRVPVIKALGTDWSRCTVRYHQKALRLLRLHSNGRICDVTRGTEVDGKALTK